MKKSFFTPTILVISLITSSCNDAAIQSNKNQTIYEFRKFILERVTEECDGNLLVSYGNGIREIKNGRIDETDVLGTDEEWRWEWVDASDLQKMNSPQFLGSGSTQQGPTYGPGEVFYRDITPNGVSEWQRLTTQMTPNNIEVRYSLFTNGDIAINYIEFPSDSYSNAFFFDSQHRMFSEESIPTELQKREYFEDLWWDLFENRDQLPGQNCKDFSNTENHMTQVFGFDPKVRFSHSDQFDVGQSDFDNGGGSEMDGLSELVSEHQKMSGPSFDCSKAQSRIENLICSNSALSKLDYEMSESYKIAISENFPIDSNKLKHDQRLWLKENSKCENSDCLISRYENRILFLQGEFDIN